MNKSLFSLILSEDVVAAVDRLAYSRGTNRSNMVNQILAEYVSYITPEKRMEDIFRRVEQLLGGGDTLQVLLRSSDSMINLRSALAYKYNPSVRYTVELYRIPGPCIGELKVYLRTQNSSLTLYMMQFYKLWKKLEDAYMPGCESQLESGKYIRRLMLRDYDGKPVEDISTEIQAEVIAGYVSVFDRALKAFFYSISDPKRAISDAEEIYLEYLRGSEITV